MDASSLSSSQGTHGLLLKSKLTVGDREGSRHLCVTRLLPRKKGVFPRRVSCAVMEAVQLHRQPAILMTGMWPLSRQAGWLHALSQEQSGPLKGSAEAPTAGLGAGAWSRWAWAAFPGLRRNIKGLVAVCHPGLDVWVLRGQRLASYTAGYKVSLKRKQTV